MENQGWIKFYRSILQKGYYRNSKYVHLWVHLLLKVNHKENEFMFDGGIIKAKAGQVLTGRKQLALETGISETTIERILDLFEKEGQIGQQKNNKFRLITVINWKDFQENGQQTDNKRTTNGQQTDTNNNVKNDKKEKNTIATEAAEVIPDLLISTRRDIQIIGQFAKAQGVVFTSKEHQGEVIKRNLKAAKALIPYPDEKIIATMAYLEKVDYISKWTLETVGKYIDTPEIDKPLPPEQEIKNLIKEMAETHGWDEAKEYAMSKWSTLCQDRKVDFNQYIKYFV